MSIEHPYLLFLGNAADPLAAKTAAGVAHWRPEWCAGQLRLDDCHADLGLPDLTLEEAAAKGVRTIVVGVANRGGIMGAHWVVTLERGIALGMGRGQRPAPAAGRDAAPGRGGRKARAPAVRRPPAAVGSAARYRRQAPGQAPAHGRQRRLLRQDVHGVGARARDAPARAGRRLPGHRPDRHPHRRQRHLGRRRGRRLHRRRRRGAGAGQRTPTTGT